jgi:hypothetical protein
MNNDTNQRTNDMNTLEASITAKGLTIADLTTTEQRGYLRTYDHTWSGHFTITQCYGSTWITRRKIGSPKTVAFLPIQNLNYVFTPDATAKYEG